jgi:short-subunit dehydrogenase
MSLPVAVVTGAGSGIGRALAQQLDTENYELVLSDISAPGLAETQAALKRKATLHTLDVSRRPEVEQMAKDTISRFGRVDLVINNAGVAVDSTINEVSYEDFEWLFGINFWGVVYGTKAFLPKMLEQKSGTIVNISSVFGLISVPRQGTYNAAKFAVRGFTEALWAELDGTGVSAVSVHPGGIKTNIARKARVVIPGMDQAAAQKQIERTFDKLARTTPEAAAATIMRGVYEKKRRVLIGPDAHAIHLLSRLMPDTYTQFVMKLDRRSR